ncbi:hypothetical protein DEH81_06645 [Pectobacterium zantedeschiae]|nr:hypothetical protein DEH81_06645 [Pectobacterium zantedeschiae]
MNRAFIPVILQVACALAAFKYSARRGPRPEGPLQAAFKSAPGRFVTRITYRSMLIGMPSLAALFGLWPHPFGVSASTVQKRLAVFVLKLELFRV